MCLIDWLNQKKCYQINLKIVNIIHQNLKINHTIQVIMEDLLIGGLYQLKNKVELKRVDIILMGHLKKNKIFMWKNLF